MKKNKMSFEIIPSIVTSDSQLLLDEIRQIETMTDKSQIDLMDGRFIPLKSISPQELAPIKTNLFLIAHLMVFKPETYLKPLAVAGIKETIFHYETTSDPFSLIRSIKGEGMGASVAIKLETPVQVLDPLISQVDSVVFLAVEPRVFGSPFQPKVLDKINAFRRRYPKVIIGVDGGIRLENIKLVKAHGIDKVYVGTAIFSSVAPSKNFQALKDAAGDSP